LGTDSPMEPDTLSRRVLRWEESVPSRISCAPEFYFARRKANLRKSLPLHDLRHHAVSRLIEQGANIMLVSRIAGHAKPWVTLGVYAHLFAEGIEEGARGSTRWLRGMKRRWGHASAALSHMDGGNPRAEPL
jgi:integrase-like protein